MMIRASLLQMSTIDFFVCNYLFMFLNLSVVYIHIYFLPLYVSLCRILLSVLLCVCTLFLSNKIEIELKMLIFHLWIETTRKKQVSRTQLG